MPSTSTFLVFLATAITLAAVPGPSVLFVVGRSIAQGRRVGVLSAIGADTGALVLVVAVAFGIGAVISASELAYWIIKFAGAGYLVFLGIQAILHRKRDAAKSVAAPRSLGRSFLESFTVGATNPKTLAILTSVLPQFTDRQAGSAAFQILVLGIIYWLIAMFSDTAWALGAGLARNWFGRSQKRREHLGAAGGVMMIAMGGVLAVGRRSS